MLSARQRLGLKEVVEDLDLAALLGGKLISEFLEGLLGELGLLPQVGGEVAIETAERVEGGLGEVAQGRRGARRRGEDVGDTGVLQDPLGGGGANDAGTAGGGHEADVDGTALAVDLVGLGVGQTDLLTPVAAAHGDNLELGGEDGATDGVGNLLADLDTKTNVAVEVTDEHERLEAGTLTGAGLLLHGLNLHDLVLDLVGAGRAEEVVNDLVLLDGHGEEVDVLERLDLAGLYQAAELGAGHPLLLVAVSTAATATAAAAVTAAPAVAASAAIAASAAAKASPESTAITPVSLRNHAHASASPLRLTESSRKTTTRNARFPQVLPDRPQERLRIAVYPSSTISHPALAPKSQRSTGCSPYFGAA